MNMMLQSTELLASMPMSVLLAAGEASGPNKAFIQNDAVIFGILALMLAVVFYTSSQKGGFWPKFYKYVPMLLLCYFLPSLLTTFDIVSADHSKLYKVVSRYLLPASLILLTLSIDLKEILNLGPKAVIMFLAGTAGVVIGGPIAILVTSAVAPDVVGGRGPTEVWRGFSTVAGSWIGGGANQVAMREIFSVNGKRILVVDNDQSLPDQVEEFCKEPYLGGEKKAEYQWKHVTDVESAKSLDSEFRPDIVMIDRHHPGNVDDQLIKDFKEYGKIPVIVSVDHQDFNDQDQLIAETEAAEEAGAVALITGKLDRETFYKRTIAAVNKVYNKTFSVMLTVDIIVAEVWMLFLLLGVGKAKEIDKFFGADSSAIEVLRDKMAAFSEKTARIPTTVDLMILAAVCFGFTGLSHFFADILGPYFENNFPDLKRLSLNSKFFWLIVFATTFGLILSFTKARNLEGIGASKLGTVFIFMLVATIGMSMDIREITKNPAIFLVGGIWMLIHVGIMFTVGWLIKAPYFFLAVGSKANIGGAASAPVVAAAFHPSLAPVGVLLAVLGYALGTYCAWFCAYLMSGVAPIS